MTQEENELLARTGPGTPCGELLRRYWQPVALAEELPPGGVPLPLKLLGEELVLFRDERGRVGLLGLHCSHRGADLSYGRLEDGGLRCIYHGWLYDVYGRCLDQPGEPLGGKDRDAIRHPAYPCLEKAGIIFAYLGPGEAPLFPNYEMFTAPENHVCAAKIYHECNYLQGNEGNLEMVHLSFLHFNRVADTGGPGIAAPEFSGRGGAPEMETMEAELTDFGVRFCKIRSLGAEKKYLRVGNFVMPNLALIPGPLDGKDGCLVNWHVPIDDTHHWKYMIYFSRVGPIDEKGIRARDQAELGSDYRAVRAKANRYLQNRVSMKSESYSGMGFWFPAHDLFATQGAGPIQDRTKEHLVPSDVVVVASRKTLLAGIKRTQEGQDPLHVLRKPDANLFGHLFAYSGIVPAGTDWKEYCKQLTAEVR